ncbi:DNA helicase [Arthrobacter phage Riverdale]|uniref:DNA helicase n=4 Tax=Korravirus glenn TaxID=1982079 RepID=A0A0U4JZ58_9CAUD|nr:DNA helicase [Arthrobacter phage Glenn]ALY08940.1 DNA helicase [Arthrobacter phage Glenn]AOT24119.1 DNA helicase [Arthrobacter phage Vallejo]AZF97406.1 DNA helicase [Arthrobacter phage Carpal]AZS09721.1 DNA helicase [Arthrobacter phage Riverdale]
MPKSRPPLLQHQKEGIEWIRTVKRGLCGDEPGLGKSRLAIEAFDGPNNRNAIIAPAMVINGGTWRDQLAQWSNYPENWTVIPYSGMNLREKTAKGGLKPTSKLVPELTGSFHALVVDESHYTKGRNTYWTKSVEQLAKNCDHVLEMTGTPIPNWAHEMFTLLRVMFPEKAKRGGPLGSYWRWVETWFDVEISRHREHERVIGKLLACRAACYSLPPTTPCEHYSTFMSENLGDKFLRRLREDCIDLPPVTNQEILVPMDTAQKKHYREMKKHFMTEVDDKEILSWSTGARHVALDRISVSPWLLNPVGEPRGGKFEQLRFDLAGRARPTLVLAHYRDVVEASAAVARSTGATAATVHGGNSKTANGSAVQNFKDGKLDVLVGSLEMVSEGLQLTVADMAIFVETSYKPYRNEQARQRVHRLGQTRPVTIKEYITPDTVDANKRVLLAEKTTDQIRFMSAGDFKKLL